MTALGVSMLVVGVAVGLGALPWVVGYPGVTFPYIGNPVLRWPAVWLWNTAETFRIRLPGRVGPWLFEAIMGKPGRRIDQ